MSENGEMYTAGKNFTLPPAVTAWTNSTSVILHITAQQYKQYVLSIAVRSKRLLTNVAPHPPCFSAVLFAKTIIQGYSFTWVYICKHFLFFAKFLLYYLKNLSFGASYYSSALFHSAMARISFKIEADQTFRKWTNGNNLDHKDNDV